MSIRDSILAATTHFHPTAVEIPELGETVHVRPLTLGGLSRFQAALAKDPTRGPVVMLVDCLCDATGARLFTSADEAQLSELPSAVAQRLVEIISESSALTPKTAEANSGN
jgi:hypothetical protein